MGFVSYDSNKRGRTCRRGLARIRGHQARRQRLARDVHRWLDEGHTIEHVPSGLILSGRCFRWPVDNEQTLLELLNG